MKRILMPCHLDRKHFFFFFDYTCKHSVLFTAKASTTVGGYSY